MSETVAPKTEVVVVVNRFNKIISLSSNWTEVAAEGGAEQILATDKVIGKDLDSFISSDTTRMYIESCLKLCRLRKQTIFREYRCDSPTHKRFMELQLTPLDDGVVEMKHFLLREEPFDVPIDIQEVSQYPTKAQYIRCSMCNRLKQTGTDEWVAPESLHMEFRRSLPVIHSVCPDCMNALWQNRTKPR